MYNFSIDDEGILTIPKDVVIKKGEELTTINNDLYGKLYGKKIYVYANEYTLWITHNKALNARAKILQTISTNCINGDIRIELGRYLPCMFQKKDGKVLGATSTDGLYFYFCNYSFQTTFLKMDAYGKIFESSHETIRKLLGKNGSYIETTEEYTFPNGTKVKLPVIKTGQKDNLSDCPRVKTLSLSSSSVDAINCILTSPLEEDDYLYLRPIIVDEETSLGENYRKIYLLPIREHHLNKKNNTVQALSGKKLILNSNEQILKRV
jgi:hypothetical protein